MPDLSFLGPIVSLLKEHAYGGAALAMLVAVLNVGIRYWTPAELVEKLDKYPRVHALLSFLTSVGIDPVRVIQALVRMVTGASPPPAASKAADGTVDVVIPSTAKDEAPVSMKIGSALLFVGALSLLGSQTGCTWAQAHEGQLIDDGVKFGLCITHELLLDNHDYAAIAVKCGKQATADVIALITEQDQKITATLKAEKADGFKEGVQASVGVCRGPKP